MQPDDLIRMANQIAHFFAPYPEEEAREGVRDHLLKFWTPAMRHELVSVVAERGPSDSTIHPLVLHAVQTLNSARTT